MDTTPLRDAYRELLAAAAVAGAADTSAARSAGEWNADQILAHVSLVNAATIAAAARVASGENTTYDNRTALDTWTIDRVIALTGSSAGLRARIRIQADVLCALGGPALSEAELDKRVPTLLLSAGEVLVDRSLPLTDDLIDPRPAAPGSPEAGRPRPTPRPQAPRSGEGPGTRHRPGGSGLPPPRRAHPAGS
jgi:hypothetical protein